MSTDNSSITIDLFRPDHPETVTELDDVSKSDVRILQSDAVEAVKRLVKQQVEELGGADGRQIPHVDALSYPRSHRAILIEGGRGSGKTTALLKAMKEIKAEYGKDVCVLQMIDPTLIETKDHIILVILQMIESEVGESNADSEMQEKLDKAREALAEGLALLEGIGPKDAFGSDWEDANWVMSEGLRKAKKGRLFERKFNGYIECALQALNKKALVLAFDDVDTNFQRGYTILETIRKYLTSPRLCLILSGDLDLYGRLVRKHIYATFGSDVLKHDQEIIPAAKNSLAEAALELEEQYLLKILPPQFRIKMQPLSVLIRRLNEPVAIRETTRDEPELLEKWAARKIGRQMRESGNNPQSSFLNVVFSEHLRLVLGYLRGLALAENQTDESRAKVLQVFGTRLRAAGIAENLIHPSIFDHTLRKVFEWVVKNGEPSTLITFRNPEDPQEAIILHCMALALADGLEDGSAVLKALFGLALPAAMMKETRFSTQEQHAAILGFLWRRGEIFLPDAAARMVAIQRADDLRGRMPVSVFGSVGLARRSSFVGQQSVVERVYGNVPSIGNSTIEAWKSKIDADPNITVPRWLNILIEGNAHDLKPRQNVIWFTIDAIRDYARCCAFEPIFDLLAFRHLTSSGERLTSVSALSLFASVGELLAHKEIDPDRIIKLSLDELTPHFGQGIQDDYDKNTEAGNEDEVDQENDEDAAVFTESDDQKAYSVFLSNLAAWLVFARSLGDRTAISPAKLGDLANRINDDLKDLDDLRGKEMPTATGQILHRQLTTILNAIVVVTSDLSGRRESPKTSDAPFGRALRRANPETHQRPEDKTWRPKDGNMHPFAAVMLSCPLVWAFLDPDAVFKQSDTSIASLRDTAVKTLKQWYDTLDLEGLLLNAPDFEAWTKAPEVTVKISNITMTADKQKTVKIRGFYELLNVVPRYAGTSSGKSNKS